MTQPYAAGFVLTVLGRMFSNVQHGMFIDWSSPRSLPTRYVRAYDKCDFI